MTRIAAAMTTHIGRAITCTKCGEGDGTMLRIEDAYVHQHCQDKEAGIERKPSPGRPMLCPKCGRELLNRRRGGRISIGKMQIRGGNKAILECECGYRKAVANPFGIRKLSEMERAKAAAQRKKTEMEAKHDADGDAKPNTSHSMQAQNRIPEA